MLTLQPVLFAGTSLLGANITETVCRHMIPPEAPQDPLRKPPDEDQLLTAAGERFFSSLREEAVRIAGSQGRGLLICGQASVCYVAAGQWRDPGDFHIEQTLDAYDLNTEALVFMEYPRRTELLCLKANGTRISLGEWSLGSMAIVQHPPELLARHG